MFQVMKLIGPGGGLHIERRRLDSRKHAKTMLRTALSHPVSRNMAGYWQLTGKAERALVGWTPLTGMAAAEAPWVSG